ncbi:hypothetical protein ACIBD9_04070 [Micromonospora sp. NPDC050784]|uniref:hypothetical protein n=1 Tax=Micromonospora sp. NPDC050784 TaxID=3364281 RepID=UPI0037897137
MADPEKQTTAAEMVRELAHQGLLAHYYREASAEERRRLRVGGSEIAWPLVFLRVTRPVERKRGHQTCATSVERLAPDCLDHFHDDVEAVLDDLFARADMPIENLEGWLTTWMRRATIDGYRRRRGQRGAPQRPRVPKWLADGLNRDAWLVELAKSILEWAGTEATAGTSLWPVTAWAERRATLTGNHEAGDPVVANEIEVVLTAMRRRPSWYERNVERPLGHKRAPVHFPSRDSSGGYAEPELLALVERHEKDEALLLELASQAIALMKHRMDSGDDLHDLVAEVLGTVFGALPAAHGLDRRPGDSPADPEQVEALIGDSDRLNRIVETVVELLRCGDRPSER